MHVFGRYVPCGCEARRDIMFTRGGAGMAEAVALVGAAVVVALAYKLGPN